MHVVSNVDELNFFLRRFAPRVTLRMTPDAVEVTSAEGHFRAVPVVTVVEDGGDSRVAVIGDAPIPNASGMRINVFAKAPTHEPIERLLRDLFASGSSTITQDLRNYSTGGSR